MRRSFLPWIIILTLSLGIGSTTAVLSIAHTLFAERLPYPRAEDLVVLGLRHAEEGLERESASRLEILDWQRASRQMAALAAFGTPQDLNLTGAERPEAVRVGFVSAEYFQVLGVEAAVGRTFLPEEDDEAGAGPVVVLSDGLWRRSFGAEPGVVGTTLALNGHPHTVVGVAPRNFQDLSFEDAAVDLWVPLSMVPATLHPFFFEDRRARWLHGVARLAPAASIASLRQEMTAVSERLAAEFPETYAGWSVQVDSLRQHFLGHGDVARSMIILGAAAVFVLLIGAANAAGLLLVRASERRGEMAVRVALGAQRRRLVLLLLREALSLSLASAAGGLALAWGLLRWLAAAHPLALPESVEWRVDTGTLLLALVLSVIFGLGCSLVPALRAARVDPQATLLEVGRQRTGGSRSTLALRDLLVVAELAVAVILVVGSGMLLQSFLRFQATDPGFETEGLLTARVQLPRQRYAEPEPRNVVYRRLLEELTALPGAGSVSLWGSGLPGDNHWYRELVPEGVSGERPEERVRSFEHRVSAGALANLGLPLVAGRGFTAADHGDSPGVVVVSRGLADRLWPGEDPLGRRLRRGPGADQPWWTVVGVAEDALHRGRQPADRDLADHYLPLAQMGTSFVGILIRTDGDPAALTAGLRRVLARVDPELPAFDLATLEERLARPEAEPRFYAWLVGCYAGVAVFLALTAVYSVLAYRVQLRRGEIALRMALGATPAGVVRRVLGHGLRLAALGVGLGLVVVWAGAGAVERSLGGIFYETSARQPVTLALIALVMLLVAAVATLWPAWRASRIAPAVALEGG